MRLGSSSVEAVGAVLNTTGATNPWPQIEGDVSQTKRALLVIQAIRKSCEIQDISYVNNKFDMGFQSIALWPG